MYFDTNKKERAIVSELVRVYEMVGVAQWCMEYTDSDSESAKTPL